MIEIKALPHFQGNPQISDLKPNFLYKLLQSPSIDQCIMVENIEITFFINVSTENFHKFLPMAGNFQDHQKLI